MSTRPALQLDYQRRVRALPRRGTVLLAVSLLAMAATGVYYKLLSDQLDAAEAKSTQLRRVPAASNASGRSSDRASADMIAEVRRASDAVREIGLPWDELFQAVESLLSDDVTLLVLEPEPEKGTVKIGGEARNMLALLNYMRLLQDCKEFRGVYLQSHQIQQQDAQRPVRFMLVANWRVSA